MNNVIKKEAYYEVAKVLEYRDEIAQKIPSKVMDNILDYSINANENISNHLDYASSDILNKISADALCLYTYLYTKYVATPEEKEKIKGVLYNNEVKYRDEIRKRCDSQKLFNINSNSISKVDKEENTQIVAMTEYKDTVFGRLKQWLYHFIKKIFS